VGAILLAQILQAGEQRGIDDFRADVLTTNDAMLGLLARHTDVTRRNVQPNVVTELLFLRRPSSVMEER